MKKFLIEESGSYKIRTAVKALNEDDAIDTTYGYLPRFIDVESNDREVTKAEEWRKYLVEESGYYKISMTIEALNEEDAIDTTYGYLPRFIDVESDDREVTEVEE